jgi:hypothetical protein
MTILEEKADLFLEGDNGIFARDLQERLGILALSALTATF